MNVCAYLQTLGYSTTNNVNHYIILINNILTNIDQHSLSQE